MVKIQPEQFMLLLETIKSVWATNTSIFPFLVLNLAPVANEKKMVFSYKYVKEKQKISQP